MNTIYITEKEFQEFLQFHYLLIKSGHSKSSTATTVHISCEQLYLCNKKQYLFLSLVKEINLPNEESFPLLKSLYGLPAGILSHRNEAIGTKTRKIKERSASVEDDLFVVLRRALLFSQVWSIKNMEVELAKKSLVTLLQNQKQQALIMQLVQGVMPSKSFPELKPANLSIDDQVFDFQLFALGRTLGLCLKGGERMTDEERDWVLGCHLANPDAIPVLFQPYSSVILGYVLALKAWNAGNYSFEALKRQLSLTLYSSTQQGLEILTASLFFVGLLENVADRYYMTAAASRLFFSLESVAFSLAQHKTIDCKELDGYDAISVSFMNPIANCVDYYRTKNPRMIQDEFFEYEYGMASNYPVKTPVIIPNNIIKFLRETKSAISFQKLLSTHLIITDNESTYASLKSISNNVLYYHPEEGLSGNLSKFDINNASIYTDCALIGRFAAPMGIKVEALDNLFLLDKQEWIILTSDFQLNTTQRKLLSLFEKRNKPKRIFVYNFAKQLVEQPAMTDLFSTTNYGYKQSQKSKKNNYYADKSVKKNEITHTVASLQSEIEQIFPKVKVNVLSKYRNDSPWEVVGLGIGMMQHTRFEDCMLIDVRNSDFMADDFITVTRSFSDIIVYDEQQRYLFLNL